MGEDEDIGEGEDEGKGEDEGESDRARLANPKPARPLGLATVASA